VLTISQFLQTIISDDSDGEKETFHSYMLSPNVSITRVVTTVSTH